MKTAVNLVVIGNLYKSGFRFYAQQKGIDLGIVGTISYQGEFGDISIHAEGEEEIVKTFTNWCAKGLPYCKVLKVDVQSVPLQNYNSFDIVSVNSDSPDDQKPVVTKKKKSLGARIFGF
ncbi:MAG: acylphosphatase [Bacteroidales bacterium]|nr:acylphosphatase [Bacteroidales bacterium]MBK9357818.1 acylphosphatase [Bacteroidales bacterium]